MLLRIFAASCCLLFSALACRAQGSKENDDSSNMQESLSMVHTVFDVPDQELVQLMAAELNCTFTFEYLNHADSTQDLSNREYRFDGFRKHSPTELINDLRELLPNYTIVRDEDDPKVIHLIDSELLELDDYPLEKKASLTYEGPLHEAITRIAREGPRVFLTTSAGNFIFFESEAHIKVRANDRPVRQILTETAGRNQVGRILWTARTKKRDKSNNQTEKYYTSVVFEMHYETAIKLGGGLP